MSGNDFAVQSVFDNSVEAEKEFDNTIGALEDDELVEAVESLDIDPGTTPKDLAKDLGEGHDTENKPTCDSNDSFDIDDEGLDLACPKMGVADAVQTKEVDPEDIEGEAEKSADVVKKDAVSEAVDALLKEAEEEFSELDDEDMEGDPGDVEEGAEELGNTDGNLVDELEEGCEDNDDCDDDESEEIDIEIKDDEPTAVETPDATKGDEGSSDLVDELEDDSDEKDLVDDLEDDDESVSEAATDDDDEDDDLIDKVEKEDDGELSDKQVEKYAGVYDDDLIDEVEND